MNFNRRIFWLQVVFCILSVFEVSAQNKMNLALHRKVEQAGSSDDLVHVLVKGNSDLLRQWSATGNADFRTCAGDISWIVLPVRRLTALHELPFISLIEAYPKNIRPMNDTMRVLCRVDEVHQGLTPLTQSYKGRNVIIGYIDSGIDLTHPDFLDSLGNTRVKWLWDMKLPLAANTPQPYNYGQEWDEQAINAGQAAAHTGQDEYGHGAYVTGIGSGDGSAVNHFQGVVPESDIIVVNYDFTADDTIPRIGHAVDYIFNKASQLGKPCVINASLGDYYGSHDGRDLESQFISNKLNEQPGRVLVAAAGNVGVDYPFHVGKSLSAGDTAFTWFRYNPAIGGAYVQIFADSADFSSVRFSVGVDKVSPDFSFRGQTNWRGITSTLSGIVTLSVTNGGNRIGIVQMLGTNLGGVYSLEIFVVPDSTDYHWRFSTAGSGHYDSWNFDWVFQNLPTSGTYPPMANYQAPDTMQTIVSGMACLDNVITVGNYFNTDRHVDVNGVLQVSSNDRPRQLASNSSRGPTRDGRIKPEICAPGHHILSTGVQSLIPGMISAQPYKVASGGYHVTGGGTSASTPVVAGAAALYLEKNPGADWADVKAALTSCAVQDQFTWGPFPNNAWGYGKLDAFSLLTNCNFVGTDEEPKVKIEWQAFPNPADDHFNLTIKSMDIGQLWMVELIDLSGRSVLKSELSGSPIVVSGINQGVYFIRLSGPSGVSDVRKLILSR